MKPTDRHFTPYPNSRFPLSSEGGQRQLTNRKGVRPRLEKGNMQSAKQLRQTTPEQAQRLGKLAELPFRRCRVLSV
jgi:hypothetical protein